MNSPGSAYLSKTVAKMAGVSLRQLQWWDEQGLIVPERVGRSRCYERAQVIECVVVAALRRKGVSLKQLRKHKVFERLRIRLAYIGNSDLFVAVGAKTTFLTEIERDALGFLLKHDSSAVLVSLRREIRERCL